MSHPIHRRYFLQTGLGVAGGMLTCRQLVAGEEPSAGWIKSADNPMLSLSKGDAFDSHNIMGPAVAKHRGRYYLLYSGGPVGPLTGEAYVRYQLGLALSEDGIHWKKTGKPLLPLGKRDNFHVTPALLRDEMGDLLLRDGIWTMVYCGNRADDVELATSPDGRHWTKDPRNPVFRRAYAPNLVQVGNQVRMYYVHKPKSGAWQIHIATGPDVASLKPHEGNPILTLSQKWEAGNVIYPYVLREGSTWVMFYAAYWRNPAGPGMWTAIGMATSANGLKWEKDPHNPILKPTPGSLYDCCYTSSQAVVRDGDHYKMYYAGRIDGVHKYYAIALATKSNTLL